MSYSSYEGCKGSKNTKKLVQKGQFHNGKIEWRKIYDVCIYFPSVGDNFVAPCSHQEYYNNEARIFLTHIRVIDKAAEYLDTKGGVWSAQ